jgi:uncharacterized protein
VFPLCIGERKQACSRELDAQWCLVAKEVKGVMEHWAWWLGGVSLAGVVVVSWLINGRLLAVSGSITSLVERWKSPQETIPDFSPEEFLSAMEAATLEEFGDQPCPLPPEPDVSETVVPPTLVIPVRKTFSEHIGFLVGLIAGGLVSRLLAGRFHPAMRLEGQSFAKLFGHSSWTMFLLLFVGGIFVGFGTRMAGGCTSGHGLCGVSRLQKGSLVATVSFFGTAIALSLLLGMRS